MEVDAVGIAQIDQGRVDEVLSRVWLASQTGQYPFNNFRLPQERRNLPSNLEGPKDHGLYLFRSLLWMQGANNTEQSFGKLKLAYERHRDMFAAEEVHAYSEADICEALKASGLSHYNVRPPWWQHNSRVLLECWGGDPREIFAGMPTDPEEFWEEALRRVAKKPNKIMGAQEKITALLVDFFVDAGLVPAVDTPVAVDVRQCRVMGCTESVWGGEEIGPWKELNIFRDAVRTAYKNFAEHRDMSMNTIGNATWFFGGEMCEHAAAHLNPKGVKPRKSLEETCGTCFLSDLCNWVAPGSHHYTGSGGILFVPRTRLEGEEPLKLDPSAPAQGKCTKHQKLWTPGDDGVCVGCGGCEDMPTM